MSGRHHTQASGLEIERARDEYSRQRMHGDHHRALQTLPTFGSGDPNTIGSAEAGRQHPLDRRVHEVVRGRDADVARKERTRIVTFIGVGRVHTLQFDETFGEPCHQFGEFGVGVDSGPRGVGRIGEHDRRRVLHDADGSIDGRVGIERNRRAQKPLPRLGLRVEMEVVEVAHQFDRVVGKSPARVEMQLRGDRPQLGIGEDHVGCRPMRRDRRHLPAIDVDGDDGWNLTWISDQNETGRDVAQGEQVGPGHLPGLVDEGDVVGLFVVGDGPFRHRSHHDRGALGKRSMIGGHDHVGR